MYAYRSPAETKLRFVIQIIVANRLPVLPDTSGDLLDGEDAGKHEDFHRKPEKIPRSPGFVVHLIGAGSVYCGVARGSVIVITHAFRPNTTSVAVGSIQAKMKKDTSMLR